MGMGIMAESTSATAFAAVSKNAGSFGSGPITDNRVQDEAPEWDRKGTRHSVKYACICLYSPLTPCLLPDRLLVSQGRKTIHEGGSPTSEAKIRDFEASV